MFLLPRKQSFNIFTWSLFHIIQICCSEKHPRALLRPQSLYHVTSVFISLQNSAALFVFCLHCTVCRILVPRPGIEPGPQQWKHWVLTTGKPGNSLISTCVKMCLLLIEDKLNESKGLVGFGPYWLSACNTQSVQFSSVQSLSRVWLFATPWITAHQASLSITSSRSLLKLKPIKSVMPSSHLILCRPLLLLPQIPPSVRVFSNESTLLDSIICMKRLKSSGPLWVHPLPWEHRNPFMSLNTQSITHSLFPNGY